MSIRLPAPSSPPEEIDLESVSSSSDDDDDETWDDWISDSLAQQSCASLFEDTRFASAIEALAHDKAKHGFDLDQTCSRLSLDFHQRIRLINFIRKNKPTVQEVLSFQGTEPFFLSEDYLIPVLEDDPLIQISPDDWSDEDDEDLSRNPTERIRILEKKLASAKQDLVDYRSFVGKQLNATALVEAINAGSSNEPLAPQRDDDTHYFDSYGQNDIHAVMIQDKVRTSTYASFILTNPFLFRDAVVLDVGCGTGILSLFAARGGAKRVFAVDASDIAEKAEKIVKANGLDHIITVIRGKVEEIKLPDGITHVDIIISEWMGYALLYESMLDSVLHARDRFLRPDGVMAPSQCKMMLGLCDGTEIFKDRVDFWNDVYGFDLSIMADELYDEAIVDVVGPNTLLSRPEVVKDLHLKDVTTRQLDFSSSFNLVSTVERQTKINSLVLYFDTFFTVNGEPVPAATEVKVIKEHDVVVAELWPVGNKTAPQRRQSLGKAKEKITSFSTGPRSIPTHWKQTLFLLREPITVEEGTIVSGTFHCRKSTTNSRELEVEIHYYVKKSPEALADGDMIVQIYKVR